MLFASWGSAQVDAAGDVCESLRTARIPLIALMGVTDQITFDNHAICLHAASNRLDLRLTAMRQRRDTRDAARATEFEPVWNAFKHTRETEIVPAAGAGKVEVARVIALGIQAERMKAMKAAMGCGQ